MRIGIYDVDSKIPNLALMRISAWHKKQGHEVEHYMPLMHQLYDKIYASKIFDWSDGRLISDDMIVGGTGIDFKTVLPPEMDQIDPDYSLYDYEHNIGFSARGCRFKCGFCVVPQKEGKPSFISSIGKLMTNKSGSLCLKLLDNDFFGSPVWKDSIEEIKDRKIKVNFSQGLNIRILSERQAAALASVDFRDNSFNMPRVYFAWDRIEDEKTILRGFNRCVNAGIKPYQMQFFVLIGYDTTPEEDMHRVKMLHGLGADPYVMSYNKLDPYQKMFQRWVNRRQIFKSCTFEEYKLRKAA